ncbi:MAG: hypothetical protein ABH844_06735 [Candidatus Omnitrophota bacterium]
MIEINLLPPEMRKKKKHLFQELPVIPLIPVCALGVGVLLIMHTALSFTTGENRKLLKKLETKWLDMQPEQEKINTIVRETNLFEKKALSLRRIARPDISWARLLKGLNKAVISKIWLSGLDLVYYDDAGRMQSMGDFPSVLKISGYALGNSEKATSITAKFITSLEMSKDFSDYFERVELENMQNSEFAGEECMIFELGCVFKNREARNQNLK